MNLGYKIIGIDDLKYMIKRHLGSDPRTVRRYLRELQEFGFLKQLSPAKFKVLKTYIPKQTTLMELTK